MNSSEKSYLSFSFLGTFAVAVNGRSLTKFRTSKVQALLAYLLVESHTQPHITFPREKLMTLLWPEMPQESGQDNLRQTLYQLRKAIPKAPAKEGQARVPFLLTNRQTVQLNPQAVYDLDVAHFSQLLKGEPALAVLQQTAELYRGDFLADFYLPDSNEFETWAANQRTAYRRQALDALENLAAAFYEQGNFDKAEQHARRQLELDDLQENAHRQLMAAMTRNGRRTKALLHFEQLRQRLQDELDVEPEPETAALYKRIQSGDYSSMDTNKQSYSPKRPEQTIRFVTSFDGVRIAYATVGQGPPLVLTGTFLTHLEFDWQSPVWQHRLEALMQNHTVIRYDERGSGLSDWDVDNISFEAWVRDLEAVVEALGLDRFALYGQSQGGPVAVAYAARHPQKVSHLILFGAYARGWLNRDLTPEQVEEETLIMNLIRIGWGRDNPAFRQFFSTQLMPDASFDQMQALNKLASISATPENAYRLEGEMHRIDVQDLARQVQVATLVLHCRDDQGVPFNEGRLLASLIPDAQFVTLDSRNHLLTKDEPAWPKFLDHVQRFLAKSQGSAAASKVGVTAPTPSVKHEDAPEPFELKADPVDTQKPTEHFVGRERPLNRLTSYLHKALSGQGQVAFITGGAGRGKTMLLTEFSRRAQQAHPELVVAGGTCNAYAGAGDPHLPFREVLSLLCGDTAVGGESATFGNKNGRRLRQILPDTIQALVEHGPQLIDLFVPGKRLLARAVAAAPDGAAWLTQLRTMVERPAATLTSPEQIALFGQFTNVLRHLAAKRPLLIMLDDLQWVDEASISLLFHLSRRLAGSRILLIGAYRADELTLEQGGKHHPLKKVLEEIKRSYGDVFLDLAEYDQTEGRAFIDAFLDAKPNQLNESFRQALFQQTGGHPLFTAELLREMQARGDLIHDKSSRWRTGQSLDWQTVPARVEAVIAQRIGRLNNKLHDILTVASVEGELFTAEIVAQVQQMDERTLLQTLSQQLGQKQRLVHARGEIEVNGRYLSQFQFSHALFQQYLYEDLSDGERRILHKQVGSALEMLYEGKTEQVAVRLANHFLAAGLEEETAVYLQQAGDQARKLGALSEAIRYYEAALEKLAKAEKLSRAAVLCSLGRCQMESAQREAALDSFAAAYTLYEQLGDRLNAGEVRRLTGRVYWELADRQTALENYYQALALLEAGPETPALGLAISSISQMYLLASGYDKAIEWGKRALALGQRLDAREIIIHALGNLGAAYVHIGELAKAEVYLNESLQLALESSNQFAVGRAYMSRADLLLRVCQYDEARQAFDQLAKFATRWQLPLFTNTALIYITLLDWNAGNWQVALKHLAQTQQSIRDSESTGPVQLWFSILQALIDIDLGRAQAAIVGLERSLDVARRADELQTTVPHLGELARAYHQAGMVAQETPIVAELMDWFAGADILIHDAFPALRFVCHWQASNKNNESLATCVEHLRRAHEWNSSLETAANLHEGEALLALANDDLEKGVVAWQLAAEKWEQLGMPYQQVQSLSKAGQTLRLSGNNEKATAVFARAMRLLESLAKQLEDPALKTSFLASPLVQAISQTTPGDQSTAKPINKHA